MPTPIPETDLLHSRDPSFEDRTDEWPDFVLSNVHVHAPGDSNATISLLAASAGKPVTVVGQLDPLDDDEAHLYLHDTSTRKKLTIKLEQVYTFSYGQYTNGTTAIWAAGKAGWYTIEPGTKYKSTYDSMVDAVNILYFIADNYRHGRKKGKGKNAQVLPPYTAQELFEKYAIKELGSTDAAEGMEKFYEHKEFLISSMISGKEGLSWSQYPLYKHFYAKFPDLYAKVRRELEAPIEAPKMADAAHTKPRHTRKGLVDTASSTSTTRRRGRPPKNGQQAIDVISLDGSSDTSAIVHKAPGEPDAAPKPKKPSSKRTRAFAAAEVEVEDPIITPTKDDDTDEETKLRARKNKSSLRPRPSLAGKAAARKGGKGPAVEDDNDEDPEPQSSPIRGKRKYSETVDSRPHTKRRSSRPEDDEGIDMPTSPSNSGDAEDAPTPDSTSIPPGETSELAIRKLAHVPDPVQEDTWVCALDGCTHKVYGASNPDAQRLIREHYALHAYDDDSRVQMVKKLQAPSLPASHLMERVKMQAKADGFPGSRQMASRFPMDLPALSLGVKQKY